jgi:hypothetical protein
MYKAIYCEHLELIEKLELFDDLCKKSFPFFNRSFVTSSGSLFFQLFSFESIDCA